MVSRGIGTEDDFASMIDWLCVLARNKVVDCPALIQEVVTSVTAQWMSSTETWRNELQAKYVST